MKYFFKTILVATLATFCAFAKTPAIPDWVKAAEDGSTKKVESALKLKGSNKVFLAIDESEIEATAITLSKIDAYLEVFASINRVAPLLSDDENCEAELEKKNSPLLFSSFGIYKNARLSDLQDNVVYKALFVTPFGTKKIIGDNIEVSEQTEPIFMQCDLFKDFLNEKNVRLETYCTQIKRGNAKIYRSYCALVMTKEYYTGLVTNALGVYYGGQLKGDELIFQQSFLSLLQREFPEEFSEPTESNDVLD